MVRDRLRAPVRASTSAPTACGCTRCTSPAVGARTAASCGRSSASTRPTADMEPDRCAGVRRRGARRDRADPSARTARPVLGQRDRDRARPARARGARRRAGGQQRHVGRGRRPGPRPRAAGRHRLPAARRADAARCRVRNPRSASTPTRCSARSRGDGTRSAPRDPPSDRSAPRARGHQDPRPRQLPRRARSARCCSATSARPSTSSSRPRATRCDRSPQPFNGCQRGKLDVVADLKTPEGLEIAHRLMREVDVVHHNMRPGVAERLGVDYETAKRLNPIGDLLPHDHVGQRRPALPTWPGFDQLAPVVVRARARARRRGQPVRTGTASACATRRARCSRRSRC